MGIQFEGVAAELQEDLRGLVHRHFPQISFWSDAMTLTIDIIRSRMRNTGNECDTVVLSGGPPCQPFSSLGSRGEWQDDRSGPLIQFFALRDQLKTMCEEEGKKFHWLMEEVASMSAEVRAQITEMAGVTPVLLHAADFGWVHRARLYIEQPGVRRQ